MHSRMERNTQMLEVSNVSAKMKKFRIKDVSFTVPEGYITGLTGKNGAGKTTIMRLILDLVKKSAGSIDGERGLPC